MAGHDKLTPAGKKFFSTIAELNKLQVRIGFSAGKSGRGQNNESVTANDYEDGTTVAEVAAWNEYGTSQIPPRPFLRQSVENHADEINANIEVVIKAVVSGDIDTEKALMMIGAMQVGYVQHEIKTGGFTPNKPSTIRMKGSDRPLIDTGQMRQSVHYIIEPKGD